MCFILEPLKRAEPHFLTSTRLVNSKTFLIVSRIPIKCFCGPRQFKYFVYPNVTCSLKPWKTKVGFRARKITHIEKNENRAQN